MAQPRRLCLSPSRSKFACHIHAVGGFVLLIKPQPHVAAVPVLGTPGLLGLCVGVHGATVLPKPYSANRANSMANSIYNLIFRAFAHPETRKVGAWGLRRPRAFTMVLLLFWRRPPSPKREKKGDLTVGEKNGQ